MISGKGQKVWREHSDNAHLKFLTQKHQQNFSLKGSIVDKVSWIRGTSLLK